MGASESLPLRWRAELLRALGYSLVGFIVGWTFKEQLLLWVAEPLVSFASSRCHGIAAIPYYSTGSISPSYVYIGGAGAALVAIPFIARFVMALRSGDKVTPKIPFIVASFVAMAVAIASTRPVLMPAVLSGSFQSRAFCAGGERESESDVINDYVKSAFFAMLATALVLELGVVTFELWRWKRTSIARSSRQ